MPTPRNTIPHIRLVFGGTTGSAAQEIWACTLKLIPCIAGTPPIPPSQAQAEASVNALSPAELQTSCSGPMKDAVTTVFSALGGTANYLDYVKLNAFDETDHQVAGNTIQTQFTAIHGTFGFSTPWSSALDFYHRTSTSSRGFATHGRLSFPCGLIVEPTTGKIALTGNYSNSGPSLAAAEALWVTFLDAVRQASPDSTWYPGIVYTSTTTAKPPKCNIIDKIIASDIPGEVRTRQNALRQASPSVVVTYP